MAEAYSEKLRDPRWQKKRLDILTRDDFTCQACGDTKTTLHVHHVRYIKNHNPWEYDNADLITYCEHCHSYFEEYKRELGNPEFFITRKLRTEETVVVVAITEKGLFISKEVNWLSLRVLPTIIKLSEECLKRANP